MNWKASRGAWTDGPELKVDMDACSAVVFDGQIYCARTEIHVLSNDAWLQITSPTVGSTHWKLCVLAGSMYAIGVVKKNRNVYKFEKKSKTWTWTLVHSAVGKNGEIGSVTVFMDRICFADWKTETIEKFYPSQAESETVCEIPADVTLHFPLCVVDGRLITVKGHPDMNQVYVLDPSTKSWSAGVPLEKARRFIGATVYKDRLVIAGGITTGSRSQSVQMLVDGEWKSLPSLQHARNSCGVVVLDNVLYVIGGDEAKKSVEMLRLDED